MRRSAPSLFPFLAVLAVACGDDGGGGGGGQIADSGAVDSGGGGNPDSGGGEADATPTPDAMPAAVDCVGEPLPTTAPTTITLTGTVSSIGLNGQSPLQGMTVEARRSSDDAVIDTDTSDSSGGFELTEDDTGDVPLDAYLAVRDEDGENPVYVDTYVWPPAPLSETGEDVPVLMVNDLTYSLLLPNIAGVDQSDENGVVSVVVVDCDGNQVEGATVSSTPAGEIVYSDENGFPDPDRSATGAQGTAFIFNVPPGEVEVDAEVMGVSLREHTVGAFAGASTTTAVGP